MKGGAVYGMTRLRAFLKGQASTAWLGPARQLSIRRY
jgi:hypothetical protein